MAKSLQEGIEEQLQKLLVLKVRLHYLRAIEGDLEQVTRKKPFRIWEELFWMAAGDAYYRLVIDLASLAKGLHKHHLKTVLHPWLKHIGNKRRKDKKKEKPTPPALEKIHDEAHEKAFARLFPKIDKRKRAPGKGDVAELRAAIEARVDRLRQDRNWNRAHAFELQGTADMLDLTEISELFSYLEQVLNDLLLCATGRTWVMERPFTVLPPERSAVALVDHVLLDRVVHPLEDRAKLYADLHDAHAARGEKGFFNARDADGYHPPAAPALRDLAKLEDATR